ncbi:hypothetical protein G9A89_003255 [Geosiphon pyriformis]|nr:hypothetical protein G9A89_003255 [Geosiphon pyriformis]
MAYTPIAKIKKFTTTAPSNLSTPPNSNTTIELILKWNPKAKTDTTKLKIINSSLSTDPQFLKPTIKILTIELEHQEFNQQQPLTSNIPLATVTNNESLAAIFLFELKELTPMPLFSRAALEKKPITAIYTDVKIDDHSIKLILDSGLADSIITKQLMDQLDH